MPRAYSSDLRERVKRAVEKGGSCRQVAAQYEVSVSFVVKLMQRWRERGTLTPEPMGGRKPQRLAGHAERVRALVAGDPDLTIDGLRRRLAEEGVTHPARPGPRAQKDAARRRARHAARR